MIGLQGYWPLNEGSGTTTADVSPNGYTGTLQNSPTWQTSSCEFADCISFDGVNDNVTMTNTLSPAKTTVSAWVDFTASNPGGFASYGIFSKDSGVGGSHRSTNLYYQWNSNVLSLQCDLSLNGTTTFNVSYNPGSGIVNQWHYVACTYDGNNSRLYFDGQLQGTSSTNAGSLVNDTTNNWNIGTRNLGDERFKGSIDDVKIYNNARSATQILNDFNNKPSYTITTAGAVPTYSIGTEQVGGGPSAYWKFDEGTGTTAYDASATKDSSILNKTWQSGCSPETNCIFFNGQNNYISTYNPSVGAAFTISMWVKPVGNLGKTTQGLFDTGSGQLGALRVYGSGAGGINFETGGSTVRTATIGDWNNQWHYIALVLSGSTTTTLYIDGSQVGSFSNSQAGFSNGFDIGRFNSANYFDGQINEVKIYSAALSSGQITQDYTGQTFSPSPIDWWKLNDGSGTSIADNAGAHAGTLNGTNTSGPTWQTADQCVSGKCLYFDGSTNFVTAFNSGLYNFSGSSPSNNFTFAAWVKQTANSGQQVIIGKPRGVGAVGYELFLSSGVPTIYINNTSTSASAFGAAIPLNQWEYIVGTYDGSTLKMYVNGLLQGSASTSISPSFSGATPLTIGVDFTSSAFYYQGFIDEPKIYPYARTAAQVKADYASRGTVNAGANVLGASSQSNMSALNNGLVGYWKMDESSWNGTSGEVKDSSGNGNNGTLSGTAETLSVGKFGNAGSFNGTDQNVPISNTISAINTISFWVKPTNTTTVFLQLAGGVDVKASSGVIQTDGITNPTVYVNGVVSSTIVANQWQDITVTSTAAIIGSSIKIGSTDFATGGTVTTSGGNNIHTFTSSGIFTINGTTNVQALVIGGGGAGGVIYNASYTLPQGIYNIVVGNGGTGVYASNGNNGGNSVLNTLTAIGGGGGSSASNAAIGGSGGGGGGTFTTGASGTAGQGNAGGTAYTFSNTIFNAGGGGGSSAVGGNANSSVAGNGGDGTAYTISGSSLTYAGGGGGGAYYNSGGRGNGGSGGGGAGTFPSFNQNPIFGGSATANTGGGGGGAGASTVAGSTGGNGGSGIVIISYPTTSDSYFTGTMDEVRVYNRALSPADVQNLYNFSPGPIAYYNFEEGTGSTVNDTSGSGNTGTWNGTLGKQWGSGKIGKAGNFNGTDNSVQVTGLLGNPAAISLSGWVYLTSAGPNGSDVISLGDDAGIRLDGPSSGVAGFYYKGSGSWNEIDSHQTVAGKGWHHIEYTADPANGKEVLYIDGVVAVKATSPEAITYLGNGSNTFIGHHGNGSGSYNFTGKIDDIRVYNYARTPEQVIQDMNAGASTVSVGANRSGPVGYWKFDEGYGTISHNQGNGGSALNGTLTNMASPAIATSGWQQTGKFGKDLAFDEVNDYVDVENNAALNVSSYTLTAWIKATSGSNNFLKIFYKGNGTSAEPVSMYLFNGEIDCEYFNNPTDYTARGTIDLRDSTWHQVACVRDAGNKMYAYTDGKLVATGADAGQTTSVANNAVIGGRVAANDSYFLGQIDDVKLYSYPLTASEIKLDYNHNSGISMGSLGTAPDGKTASNSASAIYCVPGDTSTCTPPVGEWNFEDARNSSTVNDTSGNGNTGTWSGTGKNHFVQGKVGRAGNFNGTDDYVDVGSSINNWYPFASYTLSAWFKTNNSANTEQPIIGNLKNNGQGYMISINTATSKINYFAYGNPSGLQSLSQATATIKTGVWYHVVVIDNAGTFTMYLNGISLSTSTSLHNDTSFSSPQTTRIGNAWVYAFSGQIDQVRVYSYVRTPAQVAWDYNQGAPVAQWNFDECQGTVIKDVTGNGNTGTLNLGSGGVTSPGTCTDGTGTTAWSLGSIGKFNSSMSFDGTDDYVNIGNSGLTYQKFTISAWIKPISSPAREDVVNALNVFLNIQSGKVSGFIGGGLSSSYLQSSNSVTLNAWNHIVETWDGSTQTIYLNGVPKSTTLSGSMSAAGINGGIGAETYTGGSVASFFQGQIDDARIYNYALTPLQIKLLYNGGAAVRFAPLVGSP